MPNVSIDKEDTYLSTYLKLNDDDRYIIGFRILKNPKVIHHIFVTGCTKPLQLTSSWSGKSECHDRKLMFMGGLVLPDGMHF